MQCLADLPSMDMKSRRQKQEGDLSRGLISTLGQLRRKKATSALPRLAATCRAVR